MVIAKLQFNYNKKNVINVTNDTTNLASTGANPGSLERSCTKVHGNGCGREIGPVPRKARKLSEDITMKKAIILIIFGS